MSHHRCARERARPGVVSRTPVAAQGMQVTCRARLARVQKTRKGGSKLLFDIEGEDRVQSVMRGAPPYDVRGSAAPR